MWSLGWWTRSARTRQCMTPQYYARRLATALGRITEAFGWGETELMSGSRQQTLFDF